MLWDYFTPGFQLFQTLVRGRRHLSFYPPQGMTGYEAAAYLRKQGISADPIGMVSSDGEVTITVNDYGKALDALNKLNNRGKASSNNGRMTNAGSGRCPYCGNMLRPGQYKCPSCGGQR